MRNLLCGVQPPTPHNFRAVNNPQGQTHLASNILAGKHGGKLPAKRFLYSALAGLVMAAGALAVPTGAMAAPADPNCPVNDSAHVALNGFNSFYSDVNVTSDPCGYPVRAYIHCNTIIAGTYWAYGDNVTHGHSTAACDSGDPYLSWGHQVYYLGQWVTYPSS